MPRCQSPSPIQAHPDTLGFLVLICYPLLSQSSLLLPLPFSFSLLESSPGLWDEA